MLRYLNMFLIIGLALFLVSLAGFATHDHFLMEPGQAPNGNLSLIYLGASVIMVINGLVSNRLTQQATNKQSDQSTNKADQADTDGDTGTEVKTTTAKWMG